MPKNLPNQNSFLNDNFSITSKKCIEIAYCQHKEKKWQTAAFFVNIKKRSEEIIELQFKSFEHIVIGFCFAHR